MVDKLEPDTNEKIQALCKKISVAHNLDEEIQAELYTHMEDKLLAYLNGEESLAEEDAFILVREHFGDPSALKGLLQNVHTVEVQISLARRIAAAVIVTAGVSVASGCLTVLVFAIWKAGRSFELVVAAQTHIAVLTVVVPWLLLRYWQRRLNDGRTPWFLKWSPGHLVSVIAVLWLLNLSAFTDLRSLYSQAGPSESGMQFIISAYYKLYMALALASPVLQCMVWLWWCDRPPRKALAVGSAACVWTLWVWSASLVTSFQATQSQLFANSIATHLTLTLGILLIYPLVACAFYTIARRVATSLNRRRAHL